MPRFKIESNSHWHELRRQHVGASEVGALFGVHPQMTRWQLWQIKAGRMDPPDLDDNERVLWGQVIEPAIAQGMERLHGYDLQKVRTYWTHERVAGLGASLDYMAVNDPRGPGDVDCKNVDGLVFRDWEDGEPPLHLLLQIQAQMSVTGHQWGALAVLVGGNTLKPFEYPRHDSTIQKIEREVTAFWRSIAAGEEPEPDYARDAERIADLRGDPTPRTVDLSGHNRIMQLVETHDLASTMKNDWERAQKAAKAEILHALGDATHAYLPDGRVLEVGVTHYKAATIQKPAGSYRKQPKVVDAEKAKLPDADKANKEAA